MARGSISLVIVGTIMVAAFAVVVVNPRQLAGVLPPAAIDMLEGMGGLVSAGSTMPREGDLPADFLADAPDGLRAQGPLAALPGNRPVFIADVLAGHSTRVGSDIPAEITTIRPIMGCLVTPPLDGTVVGYATAGQSDLALALSTYNDTHLAEAVQRLVDLYRETGVTEAARPSALAYHAYDVAVTETSAPVYLVLENRGGNRIWNIHLAPGARIERVVLLGGDQAGVANLDPVVPVEVLLTAGLSGCGIQPAHPLNAGHALFQAAQSGALAPDEAQAQLTALADAVDAYARWLRDSFGIDARAARAGFDVGMVSVIGAVPDSAEARAVYAPISAARIRTTQDSFFEIDGQVAQGQDFASRVLAIATSFAFGDLQNLRQGADF
jgi:hypothetical protein